MSTGLNTAIHRLTHNGTVKLQALPDVSELGDAIVEDVASSRDPKRALARALKDLHAQLTLPESAGQNRDSDPSIPPYSTAEKLYNKIKAQISGFGFRGADAEFFEFVLAQCLDDDLLTDNEAHDLHRLAARLIHNSDNPAATAAELARAINNLEQELHAGYR